jgi:hypothetical protein
MKVAEYVYFAVISKSHSLDEISHTLGIPPDSTLSTPAFGNRTNTQHWRLGLVGFQPETDESHLTELVDALMQRLHAREGRLLKLSREGAALTLHIVRGFHPDPTEADLGWSLSASHLAWLGGIGASLDVDEYDFSAGSATSAGADTATL